MDGSLPSRGRWRSGGRRTADPFDNPYRQEIEGRPWEKMVFLGGIYKGLAGVPFILSLSKDDLGFDCPAPAQPLSLPKGRPSTSSGVGSCKHSLMPAVLLELALGGLGFHLLVLWQADEGFHLGAHPGHLGGVYADVAGVAQALVDLADAVHRRDD